MEFFAVIIGIGIGYALYRKNRANREEDYDDDYEEEARFEPREPVYPTRNLSYEEPRNTDPNAAIREIDEAIRAGERALDSLREAKNQLNSARNWGIYDMIGGGLISSMIKHSKIDQANEWMDQANRDLRCFAKELRDVERRGSADRYRIPGHHAGYLLRQLLQRSAGTAENQRRPCPD